MSYRDDRYYDDRPRRSRSYSGGIVAVFWALLGVVSVVFLTWMGLTLWNDVKAQYTTSNAQPTQAPAVVQPAVVATPWIIIQSVPQGVAPQVLTVQATPVPPIDPNTGDQLSAPDSPRTLIIVQHDGYQQPVITGSGACAVAKGARRCGK